MNTKVMLKVRKHLQESLRTWPEGDAASRLGYPVRDGMGENCQSRSSQTETAIGQQAGDHARSGAA